MRRVVEKMRVRFLVLYREILYVRIECDDLK